MRLVIEYQTGDGCTYWAKETIPIEYASPEAFAVDFEIACKDNIDRVDFWFADKLWESMNHIERGVYYAPDAYTVDEWFKFHGTE